MKVQSRHLVSALVLAVVFRTGGCAANSVPPEDVKQPYGQRRASSSQSSTARLQSACRGLQTALAMFQAESGEYPNELSLENLKFAPPAVRSAAKEAILKIEDYRADENGYSFVAVGKDEKTRLRVTPNAIMKLE